MKEQNPTVTLLLVCIDFSNASRRAGMLRVLRGSVAPNGKADVKVTRWARFVELVQ